MSRIQVVITVAVPLDGIKLAVSNSFSSSRTRCPNDASALAASTSCENGLLPTAYRQASDFTDSAIARHWYQVFSGWRLNIVASVRNAAAKATPAPSTPH